MENTIIVVDLGTSAVKSYLYDLDNGEVIGWSLVDIHYSTPEAGAAEVEVNDWWSAFTRTIQDLMWRFQPKKIQGITLTNQQISCALLDDSGEPVYPALLWMDTRCTEELERLLREHTGLADEILQTTGIPPSDSWGLAKLLWFKRRFPDLYKRVKYVASVDAYMFLKLCGRFVTDESNACFFHLDITTRDIATHLLDTLDLNIAVFPEVVKPGSVIGEVDRNVSEQTGLPEGLPVIAAASDQPCAMLGMGVTQPGEVVVNLGTGTFVLTPLEKPIVDSRLMTNIAASPDNWLVMGTHYLTGGAFRWLRNLFEIGDFNISFEQMDRYAEQVPPGSQGLIFLPWLSGSGTPYWNPNSQGLFAGLSLQHTFGHLARAVMESTGYGIRTILDVLNDTHVRIDRIVLAGGPTVSNLWTQIITDILQRPLELSASKEATPFGAAMLAAVALNRFNHIEEAKREWISKGKLIEPNVNYRKTYDESYAEYLTWSNIETDLRR